MTPRFSSKEFHFLKPDHDGQPVHPPETYFSDLVYTKPSGISEFEHRLDDAHIPDTGFLCAVIHAAASGDTAEPSSDTIQETVEACFTTVLADTRGIWETLDDTMFIVAFWDYDTVETAQQWLTSLKQALSRALNTQLLIGTAEFPYREYTRSQVAANALKAIDHAAFFGPGHQSRFDSVALNISGDRRYALGEFDAAIQEYEEGLSLDDGNVNLLNSLGVCFGVTGELTLARETFETAMTRHPKDLMVMYNLGLVHQIQGDMDNAVLFLRKAHGIDPQVFEVELLLGHLLLKTGKPDQALSHARAATILNPQSGTAFRTLGEIYLTHQALVKAQAAFNSAVKLAPSDAHALSGYALAMAQRRQNLPIALTFAKKSVAINPDNPVFQERLTRVRQAADQCQPDQSIKSA